jgi:hypothetical protein
MLLAGFEPLAANAQLMIIGNDQKPGLDAQRKPTMGGPGKDTLSIVDISSPAALKILATLPIPVTTSSCPGSRPQCAAARNNPQGDAICGLVGFCKAV